MNYVHVVEMNVISPHNSKSRGVAILLNNNFEHKICNHTIDKEGNVLALDMAIENKRLTLITIYGPNNDYPQFYNKINDTLENFNIDTFIVCGDFDLVLNPDLDYYNYSKQKK